MKATMKNENQPKHTPTPWYFGRWESEPPFGKFMIAKDGARSVAVTTGGSVSELAAENEANAAFIVDACNSIEDTRRVLADTVAELGRIKAQRDELARTAIVFFGTPNLDLNAKRLFDLASAAMAQPGKEVE